MKLQNKTILSFLTADFRGKKLPLKLSFALKLNTDALKGAINAYNEQRQELINKHAKKDGDGHLVVESNNYVMKDQGVFLEDMNELLDMEVEANVKTVDLDTLEKCDLQEFDTLTVDEIEAIYFMIS